VVGARVLPAALGSWDFIWSAGKPSDVFWAVERYELVCGAIEGLL
jgi:hypothetical protein